MNTHAAYSVLFRRQLQLNWTAIPFRSSVVLKLKENGDGLLNRWTVKMRDNWNRRSHSWRILLHLISHEKSPERTQPCGSAPFPGHNCAQVHWSTEWPWKEFIDAPCLNGMAINNKSATENYKGSTSPGTMVHRLTAHLAHRLRVLLKMIVLVEWCGGQKQRGSPVTCL